MTSDVNLLLATHLEDGFPMQILVLCKFCFQRKETKGGNHFAVYDVYVYVSNQHVVHLMPLECCMSNIPQ